MRGKSRPKPTAARPASHPVASANRSRSSDERAPTSESGHGTALLVIGLVALVFRAALLVQLSGTPYLDVTNVDTRSYQQWALEIAAGQWWPTKLFYQAPLYAYFLGAIYAVFGEGPWAPRLIQVAIGCTSPLLLYGIGVQLFSRRVGWIAGLALALYGPLVLEEITLSKTSPLIFLVLASFAAYLRSGIRGRLGGMAVAGAVGGLAVAAAAQWLLVFVALAAFAWFLPTTAGPARRWSAAAVFTIAGLLVFGPVVAWNSAQGGGLVLTAGGGGLNLFSGNNIRSMGLPAPPPDVRDVPEYEEDDARIAAERAVGRPLTAAEVDRYWSNRAVAFMRQQPGGFAVRLMNKLIVLWNAYEVPDNYHFAFVREHFLSLLWLSVTFGIIAPPALVGLVAARRGGRGVQALYLVTLTYLATLVIYYVRGRYRLPSVPFLMVFAAFAVDRLLDIARTRPWKATARWVAGLMVAVVFVHHIHCEEPHDGVQGVCLGGDTWYDVEWKRLATWYQQHGDRERERAFVERALECKAPRDADDTHLWLAWLDADAATAHAQSGNIEAAEASFRPAERRLLGLIERGYRTAHARSKLGMLYAGMQRPEQAIAVLEAARTEGSADRQTLLILAAAYADAGRCMDALALIAAPDFGEPSQASMAIATHCMTPR